MTKFFMSEVSDGYSLNEVQSSVVGRCGTDKKTRYRLPIADSNGPLANALLLRATFVLDMTKNARVRITAKIRALFY